MNSHLIWRSCDWFLDVFVLVSELETDAGDRSSSHLSSSLEENSPSRDCSPC